MRAICGRSQMGWHEVSKKMWVYIKAKKLQSTDDKNTINCDAKMKALTNKEIVKCTEISQIINDNLTEVKIPQETEDYKESKYSYNKDISDIQNFVNFMDVTNNKEKAFMEVLEAMDD